MRNVICVFGAAMTVALHVPAQVSRGHESFLSSSHILVPQARSFLSSVPSARVDIVAVEAGVEISEQVATTTLDLILTNAGTALVEAQLAVPVPEGAALRGFTFQGTGKEPVAELLRREEARRTYDAIVAKVKDPAILEFVGCNLIRSSVFPVGAHSGQKVRLVYEHLLPRDGDRIDYVLPRSESVDYTVPWKIAVRIKSRQPIGAVYSPSHRIATVRPNGSTVSVRLAAGAEKEPGPFRLSCLLKSKGMAASFMAYPNAETGGGYFLLLATPPERSAHAPSIKREVIVVIDRSGSMAGEKLEQARAAALQVLEGLDDGERFNVVVYNEGVECFAPEPVEKTAETMRAARTFLRELRVRGGTNIYDALQEALRMREASGFLPIVLFLTDGLPTVGQTSEKAIRQLATKGNPLRRRIFTFGIGTDVNTPLLDKLAVESRAASTYVLPKEDIEVKVAQVFRRLSGPVLMSPNLRAQNERGKPAYGRVHDMLPGSLPDLFDGDQLVVMGQYKGEEPLSFELKGEDGERTRKFRFRFEPGKASTRNAFVPRLWATRKIAVLTDAIRDLGAESSAAMAIRADTSSDPRMKELVGEVVRLSTQFGVLSEYTAFLAKEGSDLAGSPDAFVRAYANFSNMAMATRSGLQSVTQSVNNNYARGQVEVNNRNLFYDSNLNQVQITSVQQLNDGAFYRRGNRWVDSSLLEDSGGQEPRVVRVGSEEFRRLIERLVAENRQAAAALSGEILLRVGGEKVLIR